MTQPAAFDVPATDRREPSAAERFVRRAVPDPEPSEQEEVRELRTVPLKAVTDVASMVLIIAGFAVGVTAAWIAGGRVPGLATLAGALISLGFLLNL